MPFKPGEGGRPKGAANRVPNAVKSVFARLGGKDGIKYAQQLHDLATGKHDDPHVRIKALAIIAPYVWGKPVERHEHSGPDGVPLTFTAIYKPIEKSPA